MSGAYRSSQPGMKRRTEHINGIIKTLIEKLGKEERPTSEEIGAAWADAAG